jgi:hypothetical protein
MYAELSRKYPALVNRKRLMLQQDNASPHTARKTMKLQELDIKLLSHPAYSPDLVLYDFHLFWAMAHFLHGCRFKRIEDVELECHEFLPQRTRHGTGMELNCLPKDGFRP